ncbi:MAG TPA: sulfur carrier protein ThiS [Chthoniobacterales bacterium]|jgi:sulfur carrier protein
MKIFLNGEEAECEDRISVQELLQRHRLSPETMLVELNGSALHRREWAAQKLRPNDRLEILRVAAGG